MYKYVSKLLFRRIVFTDSFTEVGNLHLPNKRRSENFQLYLKK